MIVDCITRFIRRKLVLGIVFGLSLCYCIYSFSKDFRRNAEYATKDISLASTVDPKSFLWNSDETKNITYTRHTCRNSVQGKYLMADDKGYVCKRNDVTTNGCCDVNAASTKRYSCDTCKKDGCCGIYEYCISCCLHPNKGSNFGSHGRSKRRNSDNSNSGNKNSSTSSNSNRSSNKSPAQLPWYSNYC